MGGVIIVLLPVARWLTSVVNHNDIKIKVAVASCVARVVQQSVGCRLALAENDTREGENDSLDAVAQNFNSQLRRKLNGGERLARFSKFTTVKQLYRK